MAQALTTTDCDCDFLLTLSSAANHETLRERLLTVIQQQLPHCQSIIIDEFHSEVELTENKNKNTHENLYSYPINNLQNQKVGSINIVSQHKFEINNKLLQAFTLYSNIYQLLSSSHFDPLTQLHNRKSFELHMNRLYQQSLSQHRRSIDQQDQPIIGMIDIDHFKSVNDDFGHQLGDEVLVLISQIMTNTLRDDDLLFRFGGEEFVIILPHCDTGAANKTIDRLRKSIANHIFPQVGTVTVSIGYCTIDTAQNYDLLLERADAGLYYVKQNGRNNCISYEQLVANGEMKPIEQRSGDIEIF